MNTSVTQKEIAKRLGISPGMVGRALRDDLAYSLQTRKRIQEVAREMGYHSGSNENARLLASQRYGHRVRHGNIGLLSMALGSNHLPYYAHLYAGIVRAAHASSCEILTINPQPSPGWGRVDGIIGHGEIDEVTVKQAITRIPYVNMGATTGAVASVVADDDSGVRQAVEHLLSQGHRRIGYLLNTFTSTMQSRQKAYRASLLGAGIEPEPAWQWDLYDWGPMENRGRLSMKTWLDAGFLDIGLTALLVQNDRSAIGAMATLQLAGVRVPQDLSVVGFDSTDECELSSPRLTSVRVPLQEMGEKAVEMLLRQIADEDAEPETVTFPVELKLRDSTAPPRR